MRAARVALLAAAMLGGLGGVRAGAQEAAVDRMVGLYVHQHWRYKHPYAARTWTLKDWRGWAEGCRQLGYNTFLVWPMLETIPDPPTSSDLRYIERLASVVDMLHRDFGMRVYLALCPNIRADDRVARRSTFERRHYYDCDVLANPADPREMAGLMRRREALLRPLAAVDGVAIIDSDPGCYPGSTNQEFVDLLAAHRRMLDGLRPGIELLYWMHAGWRGWSRFYETGRLELGTPEEQLDTLSRLAAVNPEPWGIANGVPYAEKLGLLDRVIRFNYGLIEGEPSFPMTNFGGGGAHEGGGQPGPRGVMGNAQTHCVQLPNIFAFARGAAGLPADDAAFAAFAEDLAPGHGAALLRGWKTLHAAGPGERAARKRPKGGALAGLTFGSPARLMLDLAAMLDHQEALDAFASDAEAGRDTGESFRRFVEAASVWQRRHGYQGNWWDGKMHAALRKLGDPGIDAALNVSYGAREPFDPGITSMPDQVHANFRKFERFTPRLLAAMRRAVSAGAGVRQRARM